MKHMQNAVRLGIIVFWLALAGILHSMANNIDNVLALGWSTHLLYLTLIVAFVYIGVLITTSFWSIKK